MRSRRVHGTARTGDGVTRFQQLVISGGGTRCFWHGGFLEAVREPLELTPERITGVSGGALAAACFIAHRGHRLLEVMGDAFDRVDENLDLDGSQHGSELTPHQRVYRKVVEATLDDEAVERVADGPSYQVMLAYPPSDRLARLSTFPVMLAYLLDLAVRSTPEMRWPARLGLTHELVDAREAARRGQLVELICNAAVIPPVFNLQGWSGHQVVDGGMYCKAPMPEPDVGDTMVLLTRRFRNLPAGDGRCWVEPSDEVPADKLDFTDRDKIERTWAMGERDGERFLADRTTAGDGEPATAGTSGDDASPKPSTPEPVDR